MLYLLKKARERKNISPRKKMSSTDHQDESVNLRERYSRLGAQQISYEEYLALQKRLSSRRRLSIPVFVGWILSSPFLLIFCLGLVFLPYIVYLVLTSPAVAPLALDQPLP